MSLGYPDLAPTSAGAVYLFNAGINLLLGLMFLLTLPAVMRGLATLDAILARHLLGPAPELTARAPSPERSGHDTDRWPVAEVNLTALLWAVTSFVAVVLLAIAWPITATVYDLNPALAMVLTIAHAAAAILAVRWSWGGAGLSIAALFAMMTATAGLASDVLWPWPVTALLTQGLLIGVIALRKPWYEAAAVWAVAAALTIAAPLLLVDGSPDGAVGNGVVALSVLGALAVLGVLLRLWGLSLGRVESAEKAGAEEAHRRKGLEERNRIARDLHDVVAHSMSVITVQASTAKYRRPGLDGAVEQEFEEIAESSRQALGEMRALLGLLRGTETAPTAPVPGMADIADLVEATRAAGVEITYRGEAGPTSATVGLTAFRVIQEALSNALRHAPGSAIEVTTEVDDTQDRLMVRVVNSAPRGGDEAGAGSGLGLEGLRERVTTLGGTVSAGPTETGGFAVEAVLPLTA